MRRDGSKRIYYVNRTTFTPIAFIEFTP